MVAAPYDCYTFTVDNISSSALGEVRVNGASTYADFNVIVTGEYPQEVCFTALSVTVNGTTVTSPGSGDAQLPSGAWVHIVWQSSDLVEIADRTVQGVNFR